MTKAKVKAEGGMIKTITSYTGTTYTVPDGQPHIGKNKETEHLYRAEKRATDAIKGSCVALGGVLGHAEKDYWRLTLPMGLYQVFDLFDRSSAEAAAIGFLQSRGYAVILPGALAIMSQAELKRITENRRGCRVALSLASGIVQYAESIKAMLEEYNKHGRLYELRSEDGAVRLWHKGHRRIVGEFAAVPKPD